MGFVEVGVVDRKHKITKPEDDHVAAAEVESTVVQLAVLEAGSPHRRPKAMVEVASQGEVFVAEEGVVPHSDLLHRMTKRTALPVVLEALAGGRAV